MPITNASLATAMNDLIATYDSHLDEFDAWMNGAAGAGVASDGKFPLTTRLGVSTSWKSPAQLNDDVNGLVASATTFADAADASATAAATSATTAGTAATNALAYRNTALTYQTGAQTAESGATNEAAAALANRVLTDSNVLYAAEWATATEDVLVSTAAGGDGATDYSALHHATKASASASAASASETAAAGSETAAAASAVTAATFTPALYAELAEDETIAGNWTFSNPIIASSINSVAADVRLNYAGNPAYLTRADGGAIRHPTSLSPSLFLQDNTGVARGYLQSSSGTSRLRLGSLLDGGTLSLEADNSAGTARMLFLGDPDSDVKLYYDGLVAFTTTAAGINVQDTSGDDPSMSLRSDASTTLSMLLHIGGSGLRLRSLEHGATVALQGEDTGGVLRDIISGDPDGAITFYYAGSTGLVLANNHIEVRSYDSNSPFIEWTNDTGVRQGFIQMESTGVRIKNEVHGAPVTISSENAAGTDTIMATLDPDSSRLAVAADSETAGIQLGRSTTQHLLIYGTAGGNFLESRSTTGNTKSLSINATTDGTHGAGTSEPSIILKTRNTQRMSIENNVISMDVPLDVEKPSNFWSAGKGTYHEIAGLGHIGTDGSYGVDIVSNGYRNDAAGWTSMNVNSSPGGAKISLRHNGDLYMYGSSTVSGTEPSRFLFWDASDDVLTLDGAFLDINGKRAIRSNDAWLRLNPNTDFTSGVYTNHVMRADGGFRTGASGYSVDTSGTHGIRYVTGQHGSVETLGSGNSSWAGYSIGGRAVFMHNLSTACGLYDDVNKDWMLQGIFLGALNLYWSGNLQASTQSNSATDNISGMTVKDYGGTMRQVGFIDCERVDSAADLTISDRDYFGKLLRHTSATAHTWTLNSQAAVPNNTMITLINGTDTTARGVITIAEGVGVTIRHLNGAAVTEGNVSMSTGGVATVFKQSDTIYLVWGSGLS